MKKKSHFSPPGRWTGNNFLFKVGLIQVYEGQLDQILPTIPHVLHLFNNIQGPFNSPLVFPITASSTFIIL